ncbi:MAG TPA: c-type cytochrome [Vicinamibacteria bacterium]|nr:c-type cytochrome [Vicinamibacteria bacterium]
MAKPEPESDPRLAARTLKLNVLFAASSVGLLLIIGLMVEADHDREWRQYQIRFNQLRVKLTEDEIQKSLGPEDAQRLKEIDGKIAQGKQEEAAHRDEIRKVQAEIDALQARWYAADQDYRFTKAKLDVARYELDEAVHGKSATVDRRRADVGSLGRRWEEYRLRVEDLLAQSDAKKARLAGLERTELDAQKARTALLAEKTRLEDVLHRIAPGRLVSFVRNLPILDLANPSLKVSQIMPSSLYDDVIFTQTPKVDRCTTCHLGIDQKGFEDAPQPFTTHPEPELYVRGPHAIDKFGCTECHLGRGRGTTFVTAVHTPSTKEQEKAWGRYSGTESYEPMDHWDQPMLARGATQSQCVKCHRGVVEVPKARSLNAGIELVERYGCYGCHKIKGFETRRKVGPDLSRIATKTGEEFIFRWIKEPRGLRPTRMPQFWDVRIGETPDLLKRNNVEANAVVAYLIEHSAKAKYPPPPAGDLESGRKLFESVGCLGCHRVGDDGRGLGELAASSFRTYGPNLAGTGSKVDAGWLYAWIRDPKAYWPLTNMPSLRLTTKEAADITAYLMSLKNEDFVKRVRPAMDAGVRDQIALEYLRDRLPAKQAEEKLAGMADRERTLYLGERTIFRSGCFGCHMIPGFETTMPIGTELSEEGSKLVDRLDFGYERERLPHTLPAWLHQKFMEPRIFDRDKEMRPWDRLRMPKFFFTSEEADALVTAVLSFTREKVSGTAQRQLTADEGFVERGRRLVRDSNCRGCHVIGDEGGAIRAVKANQLEEQAKADVFGQADPAAAAAEAVALSPPLLYNEDSRIGEGARVQSHWLHEFLRDPSHRVRPWLEIRMPTFGFTEPQLNTITHYFASMDLVPYPFEPRADIDPKMVSTGAGLFGRAECVKCHVVGGKLPNQPPSNMAPDLAAVRARLRPGWIRSWLKDPQRIVPGTRMPQNFPDKPEENAYPDVLGGKQQAQIDAVTQFLLTLGPGGEP